MSSRTLARAFAACSLALALGAALPGPAAAAAIACAPNNAGAWGSTDDVSFTIGSTVYTADSCQYRTGNFNPTGETSNFNTWFGLTGGDALTYLAKRLDTPDDGSLAGISVTVDATGGGQRTGTWSLDWAEAAGAPNLPALVDFGVLLKAGTAYFAYLFEDVLLPASPSTGTGDWALRLRNPPNNNFQTISHFSLLAGNVRTQSPPPPPAPPALPPPPATPVPEPATLGLLGLGLAGLGLARRRRRAG
jgi:hypothetical protein